MQFNFVLTNHRAPALQALDDILRPLFLGLRAAGHRVIAGALQFRKAPVVNIVVEDFSDPAFVRTLYDARAAWKDDFLLGGVFPFVVDGTGVDEARRAGLRAAVGALDFAWTLAPGVPAAGTFPPERIAVVEYGFQESLVGPRLISDPAARDLDVVIYGQTGPRLDALAAKLAAGRRSHFAVRAGLLPDYIVADLISRAKVVVAVGGPPVAEATLGPRVLKAICNGSLAIAETGGVSGFLSELVPSSAYDAISSLCDETIREGRFVERGLASLERIRRLPLMREALASALALAAARAGGT